MKNNINNKSKTKQIDKTRNDKFFIIFLGVFLIFMIPLVLAFIDIFNIKPLREKLLIISIFILGVCFLIVKIKKYLRLHKAIERGTVIIKEAKIIDFVYKNGGEDSGGYYIILFDGDKKYASSFYTDAGIVGKTGKELNNDDFYGENGFTLNLKNKDFTKKQINQRISDLELQKKELNLFEKLKINLEIGELKHKKGNLEPYHLHTREGDFYIGDTARIFIDPENPDNYKVELNNR